MASVFDLAAREVTGMRKAIFPVSDPALKQIEQKREEEEEEDKMEGRESAHYQ